jgi:hypothetical protein
MAMSAAVARTVIRYWSFLRSFTVAVVAIFSHLDTSNLQAPDKICSLSAIPKEWILSFLHFIIIFVEIMNFLTTSCQMGIFIIHFYLLIN